MMDNTRAVVRGPAVRRTKALVFLQELQQAEEQRLAELHADYQPVPHLTRHEIMDSNENTNGPGQAHRGMFQKDMLSPAINIPVVATEDQHRIYKPHTYENTELFYGKADHPSYDKPYHRRALSASVVELDAIIPDRPMPELPGPEIVMSPTLTEARQPYIGYGDKRYNTLPGEAIPLKKSNILSSEPKP